MPLFKITGQGLSAIAVSAALLAKRRSAQRTPRVDGTCEPIGDS